MYLIIVSRASEYQTILFVDAEQTYIQGALDGITRQLQSIYHKNQHAFILNGCQSYLKSSPHYVRLELERCREEGISCGIKLVRGAYMEEERKVAAENNVPSPVWDKIEDTHRAYNGNLQFLLNNMNPDRDFVLIGSHNADSCNLAKPIIKGRNLTNKSYCFGQLKGFSDSLSFSLAEQGFNILKYLPYGPTEFLIPYLMRRGQESKQVMREHLFLDEISHELNKRMFRR